MSINIAFGLTMAPLVVVVLMLDLWVIIGVITDIREERAQRREKAKQAGFPWAAK